MTTSLHNEYSEEIMTIKGPGIFLAQFAGDEAAF